MQNRCVPLVVTADANRLCSCWAVACCRATACSKVTECSYSLLALSNLSHALNCHKRGTYKLPRRPEDKQPRLACADTKRHMQMRQKGGSSSRVYALCLIEINIQRQLRRVREWFHFSIISLQSEMKAKTVQIHYWCYTRRQVLKTQTGPCLACLSRAVKSAFTVPCRTPFKQCRLADLWSDLWSLSPRLLIIKVWLPRGV